MNLVAAEPATIHLSPPSLARLTVVEVRKLVDTRAGYWLLITIGLAAATVCTVQVIVAAPGARIAGSLFELSLLPAAVLLPILGVLLVTSEWSQRTAMSTFALVPRRHRVAIAKMAAGCLAALVSVLASALVAITAIVVSGGAGDPGLWPMVGAVVWHASVAQIINVLMGIAFGMVLLNSPLAIVLFFALPTTWSVLGEVVPALRAPADWLDTGRTMPALMTEHVTAGQWARIGVSVLVWVLAPMAAGLFRLIRREVS